MKTFPLNPVFIPYLTGLARLLPGVPPPLFTYVESITKREAGATGGSGFWAIAPAADKRVI